MFSAVGRSETMNHLRGVVMLVASAVAFYRGWKIHTGPHVWLAYGLGLVALGLAVWHLTRKAAHRPDHS
jgi:hypothetical protein